MHIRGRFSAADLQRARERRAWGSLLLCATAGLGFMAAGLLHRDHGIARVSTGHGPTVQLLQQQEEAAPQQIIPPTVPTPVLCVNLPCPVYMQPDPVSMESTLPEMDFPDVADSSPSMCDILPPAEFQARPKQATATHSPASKGDPALVTPPAYKNAPAPPYPAALRASRAEGDVRVRIAVDATGKPVRVDILEGSGYGEFDTCARDWILRHWEFTPARRGGSAVAGSVTTSVRFVLR